MRQRHPRLHSEVHLDFIRGLRCVICGDNTSVEAAHLRAGNRYYGKLSTGMGEKPDDKWALPVCSKDHRRQHSGNEIQFWSNEGINPWVLALSLFAASGDHNLAEEVISQQGQRR